MCKHVMHVSNLGHGVHLTAEGRACPGILASPI